MEWIDSVKMIIVFFILISSQSFHNCRAQEFQKIELSDFLQNEDIANTWPRSLLEHCMTPRLPPPKAGLSCFLRPLGYERVPVEVLNRHPPILRLPRFLHSQSLERIARKLHTSSDVESQGVEGLAYSPGHRGRQADGLWLLHHEAEIRPLYERLQQVLKYDPFGHYAPHFDHLQPMPASYDEGWFVFFGNRLATALLLVETASLGGFTTFPQLDLTISPEKGDLLLWFNADSNDRREEDALHAACPILEGQKIAVSLWIRGNFQDGLKCALDNPSYVPENLIRAKLGSLEGAKKRPAIPRWVFK